MAGDTKIETELNGTGYTWTGNRWYETKTYLTPPVVVVRELDKRLPVLLTNYERTLPKEEITTSNVDELLHLAGEARDVQRHVRAEKLVREALKIQPGYPPGLAVLCSVLRAKGLSQQALTETEPYQYLNYPPLITSRAAAWCDLDEWTKAKKELSRALAIGGDDAAYSVLHRIKANRPELYD